MSGKAALDLAFRDPSALQAPGYLSTWVPLRIAAAGDAPFSEFSARCSALLEQARRHPAFALDLVVRDPAIKGLSVPQIGLSLAGGAVEGSVVTVEAAPAGGLTLWFDTTRLPEEAAAQLAQRLESVLEALGNTTAAHTPLGQLPIMSGAEREQVLYGWNDTRCDYERQTCVHQFFQAQVARTPQAT
ncbi:MAG: peptide synthetase, partial [Rubrivivax sp.]